MQRAFELGRELAMVPSPFDEDLPPYYQQQDMESAAAPPPYGSSEGDRMSFHSLQAAFDQMDSYTWDRAIDDHLAGASDDEAISGRASTVPVRGQRCALRDHRGVEDSDTVDANILASPSASGRPPRYTVSELPRLPSVFGIDIYDSESSYRHRVPLSVQAKQAALEGVDPRTWDAHSWERILQRANPRVGADHALLSRNMVTLGGATDPLCPGTMTSITEMRDDESDIIGETITYRGESREELIYDPGEDSDDSDDSWESDNIRMATVGMRHVNDSLEVIRHRGVSVSKLNKGKRKFTFGKRDQEGPGFKLPKLSTGQQTDNPKTSKYPVGSEQGRKGSIVQTFKDVGRRLSSFVMRTKRDSGYGSMPTTPDSNHESCSGGLLSDQELVNNQVGNAEGSPDESSALSAQNHSLGTGISNQLAHGSRRRPSIDAHTKAGKLKAPRPSVVPPGLSTSQASALASRMGMEKIERSEDAYRPQTRSSCELNEGPDMKTLGRTMSEAVQVAYRSCQFSESSLTNRFDNMRGNRGDEIDPQEASTTYKWLVAAHKEEDERLFEQTMRGLTTPSYGPESRPLQECRGNAYCLHPLRGWENAEQGTGAEPGPSRRTLGSEMAAIGGAIGSALASSGTPMLM